VSLTFQGHATSSSRGHSIPHRPIPICFFRQFFGKTHRLAMLQTTDRRKTVATGPLVRSAKKPNFKVNKVDEFYANGVARITNNVNAVSTFVVCSSSALL